MATARTTSVGVRSPGIADGGAEEIRNAVFLSAMAGRRAMAVTADREDDAALLAMAVASRMEAAGAVIMTAVAQPGTTLDDLLDQATPPRNRPAGRGSDGSPAALASRLLQGEDAGLLVVLQAHALDAGLLGRLLALSRAEPGEGRLLQVLLAGTAGLGLDQDGAVSRWHLALPQEAGLPQAVPGGRPTPGPHRLRIPALACVAAIAAAGWLAAAGREPAPVRQEAAEAPASAERPVTAGALLVSSDHGPAPSIPAGETVVVRVETASDSFVYCYYTDGLGQVARLFPNRFQPDALVPAGRVVEVPPGPDRPFHIRLDTPGRPEVVTCLASPAEVDGATLDGIDGVRTDDLLPIPGLELQDILGAFARLSGPGVDSATMPITVTAAARLSPYLQNAGLSAGSE
ncbi:DUF4384 domain-containing protein [Skermanella sp. TT6]|uniref:DUF4384 domain-containing protein n=1 Tax=Skermanella cutis TaxID=2775420 RepID=A0ABX7BAW7_9PROT|nr:DUF4384 domain-containing protein [Skermanella sp. TT6]QQP90438.1 DUF4384 domain-containing protein [Skermanella sp. TT6]